MKFFVTVFACVLLSSGCGTQPVEDSVVSVYTTQSTTAGTGPSLDVYHQIANNIAERITSPIYKFLGYNTTTTSSESSTKQSWGKIELLDDQDIATKPDVRPIENEIFEERDVEELSEEKKGTTKSDKKPEKITLYSSLFSNHIPPSAETSVMPHIEMDTEFDSLEFEDVMPQKPSTTATKSREGPLIYVMEFFGSILQLIWGGVMSLFKPAVKSL